MATLPNLDTSLIGLIAYWNLGVAVTNADLLTLAGNMQTVQQYDNGLDGTLRMNRSGARDPVSGPYSINVRVRTDGILIAWNLRAADPQIVLPTPSIQTVPADGTGPFSISRGSMQVYSNTSTGGNKAGATTMLAEALAVLDGFVTTGGKTPVNKLLAGHFDYQFPATNKIYLIGDYIGVLDNSSGADSFTFTQPAAGNAVQAMWFFGSCGASNNGVASSASASAVLGAITINTAQAVGIGGGAAQLKYIGFQPSSTNYPLQAPGTVNLLTTNGSAPNPGGGGNPHGFGGMIGGVLLYAQES